MGNSNFSKNFNVFIHPSSAQQPTDFEDATSSLEASSLNLEKYDSMMFVDEKNKTNLKKFEKSKETVVSLGDFVPILLGCILLKLFVPSGSIEETTPYILIFLLGLQQKKQKNIKIILFIKFLFIFLGVVVVYFQIFLCFIKEKIVGK